MSKVFGEFTRNVIPGDWFRVQHFGHPLAKVELKIGSEPWRVCYHDDGDAALRVPSEMSGSFQVRARNDQGVEVVLGVLNVIPPEGKNLPSAYLR